MRVTPQEMRARLETTRLEAQCLAEKMPDHVESEVLVKLPDKEDAFEFASDYGCEFLERFQFPAEMAREFGGQLVHLRLPDGLTTAQGIAVLDKDPRVIYVESNDVLTATATPDDLDPKLWGMKRIEAEAAWDTHTGRRDGPIIAVIDSGIDLSHPDLAANLWTNPREVADGRDNDGNGIVDDLHGYNTVDKTGHPQDDNNHGSHCSGTIAGVGNNGQGVVGVNWEGRLLAGKFLGANGKGTLSNAVKAIAYATDKGARIQSHSWGSEGGWGNGALEDALRSSGSLHIAAAGNDADNLDEKPHYPAAFDLPNLISVAATDSSDQLASFSNYGAVGVDLAAPGVSVYSTTPNNGYQYMSGTSMATPHVAGVAGLIASAYPDLNNAQLRERLLASVDVLPQLEGMLATSGRLNARKAIEYDTVAPGPAEGLTGQATAGELKLRWTAPGDDANVGRASRYQLRLSDSPLDEGSFDRATPVEAGLPAEAGTAEERSLLLFPSDRERTVHVGLKAVDNVGNRSQLRTAAVRVPAARVAFDDNMDGFFNSWGGDGWGRVSVTGRGKVWTDSPSGEYENGANRALTSPEISLEGVRGSSLTFDCRHDLENRFDKVALEASSDGQNWTSLREFTGRQGWDRYRVDLSAFDGRKIRLRFRLTS
ncbi:MAG: S8 family serine peptidase, partial [Candidatus Eremiobacterota bacterium]